MCGLLRMRASHASYRPREMYDLYFARRLRTEPSPPAATANEDRRASPPASPRQPPRNKPNTPKARAPLRAAATVSVAKVGVTLVSPSAVLRHARGRDQVMDRLANPEGEQAGHESTDRQESPHPAEPLLARSPAGRGFPLLFLPLDWE